MGTSILVTLQCFSLVNPEYDEDMHMWAYSQSLDTLRPRMTAYLGKEVNPKCPPSLCNNPHQ